MFDRIVSSLFLLLLCTASAVAQSPAKITGKTMGTYYAVTIPELPEGSSQDDIASLMEERLTIINGQMSTWDPNSEISKFNQWDQTSEWFAVSSEFAGVVVEAKRIFKLTNGAFDPTVSPVIDLWGFGDKRPKNIPTDSEIQQALQSIGLQHIEVRTEPPSLKKTKPGIQLNLSAIAKGYGVDDLALTLEQRGIQSYLVDVGGETRAGASKPDGQPWKLGIESPLGGLQQIVKLAQESIATSGDYRNFFERDGRKYSHAINPVTGRPVEDPPASVSVRHPSCMTADALATAFMVMPAADAVRLADAEGLDVLFQKVSGETQVDTVGTGDFDAPPKKQDAESKDSMIWLPFVAAAVIFLLAVAGMSLGTMIQNRQIKGSCGGLASLPGHDGKSACDMCSIPRDQCSNSEVRERIKAMAEQTSEAGQDQA